MKNQYIAKLTIDPMDFIESHQTRPAAKQITDQTHNSITDVTLPGRSMHGHSHPLEYLDIYREKPAKHPQALSPQYYPRAHTR